MTTGIRRIFACKPALFGLVVLVVLLDQVSKSVSDASLEYATAVAVFPGFDLLLVYNTGAAFSFLSDAGGWQRWLLTGISLVVSILVFFWLLRLPRHQTLLALALALILAGAVGNLIDRAYLGYVIDFISLYAGNYRFATFNIADAAISIGAALLVLDALLEWRKNRG